MKQMLLSAASLLVFFQANFAYACSCLPRTPQQHFETSEAVFAGRVIDVIQPNPEGQSFRQPRPASEVKVIFEVSRIWKGQKKPRIVVMTSSSSASCGYSFQKREQYLVYASRQESQLETGLCSGTKPLSLAQEDLAVLGQGLSPRPRR
jgi:Tissue inhibitor of metalloproteinase